MKSLEELKNKKVAILGMGIEGFALAELLHDKVAELFLLDKNTLDQLRDGDFGENLEQVLNYRNVSLNFGEKYLTELSKFDVIFRSPGISLYHPALIDANKKGVVISSQIKLFFYLCPCPIIGVTGTKGKGTTSSLIYEILKNNSDNKSYNSVYIAGNIGYPAVSLLSELLENDLVILELSSFQLMDLSKSPHISVITNLLIDHLDYHKNVEEYRNSKLNILLHQSEKDYAVVNKNVLSEFKLDEKTKAKIKTFSKDGESDAQIIKLEEEYGVEFKKDLICKQSEINLLGIHNLENIAAATIVADICGVRLESIRKTVLEFKGLPHRLEDIGSYDEIRYINDSFATNPEPTIAAIRAIDEDKVVILGGSSKGADFLELAEQIVKEKVIGVVLIGEEGDKIQSALKKAGYQGKIIEGGRSMEEIVLHAKEIAKPGTTVLLSPACASFGLFKNYKDRGLKFRDSVLKLSNE